MIVDNSSARVALADQSQHDSQSRVSSSDQWGEDDKSLDETRGQQSSL